MSEQMAGVNSLRQMGSAVLRYKGRVGKEATGRAQGFAEA